MLSAGFENSEIHVYGTTSTMNQALMNDSLNESTLFEIDKFKTPGPVVQILDYIG